MNAHDADSVAGTIRRSGWMPVATAMDASTGRTISVVAVLDVSSVRNVRPRQVAKMTISGGTPASPVNCSPMNAARPVT